jgi:hypothetical protein
MAAIYSSETFVFTFKPTRSYKPKGQNQHLVGHEKVEYDNEVIIIVIIIIFFIDSHIYTIKLFCQKISKYSAYITVARYFRLH